MRALSTRLSHALSCFPASSLCKREQLDMIRGSVGPSHWGSLGEWLAGERRPVPFPAFPPWEGWWHCDLNGCRFTFTHVVDHALHDPFDEWLGTDSRTASDLAEGACHWRVESSTSRLETSEGFLPWPKAGCTCLNPRTGTWSSRFALFRRSRDRPLSIGSAILPATVLPRRESLWLRDRGLASRCERALRLLSHSHARVRLQLTRGLALPRARYG